jgi:hypothetical protein
VKRASEHVVACGSSPLRRGGGLVLLSFTVNGGEHRRFSDGPRKLYEGKFDEEFICTVQKQAPAYPPTPRGRRHCVCFRARQVCPNVRAAGLGATPRPFQREGSKRHPHTKGRARVRRCLAECNIDPVPAIHSTDHPLPAAAEHSLGEWLPICS